MNKSFLLFVLILLVVTIFGWIERSDSLWYYSEDILCRYKTPISCGIYKTLYCNGEFQDKASIKIIRDCGCSIDSIRASYGNKLYIDDRCNMNEYKMSGYEILLLGMRIDVNNASVSDLISVDGVGDSLAERIIEYRAKVGKIERIEKLTNVKGIGKKSIIKLSKFLCVDCL